MKIKLSLAFYFLFILAGCVRPTETPSAANGTGTPGMPNPASVYCEQQGYRLEIRTAADGTQAGVCIFPDGSECDEWAYYRRECTPATQDASMPNPASVFCEQQGYKVEIRTASDGSQSGACVFTDGSECDEWAYFRGECKPAATSTQPDQAWQTYTNESLGYTFDYPPGAQVTSNDDPLKSLSISGGSLGGDFWGIAHPSDREEYRPPEGVDLQQWLTDHYLLGENQQASLQIAGTVALHFRHEASPQSTAFDQYYLAHAGQLYQLTIGHGSPSENWELANRFLQSFHFIEPTPPETAALPTALPIDPAAYQDWTTYTNPDYGFSLKLPDGWVVNEAGASDPLLVGHEITISSITSSHPASLRLTFRRLGEDTLLWPTGVGEGEFVQQGTLEIGGQPSQRLLLVCPTGNVTAIWYHQADAQPNIILGDLEFGIIFSLSGHCEPGNNLVGNAQQLGETIIASISAP